MLLPFVRSMTNSIQFFTNFHDGRRFALESFLYSSGELFQFFACWFSISSIAFIHVLKTRLKYLDSSVDLCYLLPLVKCH